MVRARGRATVVAWVHLDFADHISPSSTYTSSMPRCSCGGNAVPAAIRTSAVRAPVSPCPRVRFSVKRLQKDVRRALPPTLAASRARNGTTSLTLGPGGLVDRAMIRSCSPGGGFTAMGGEAKQVERAGHSFTLVWSPTQFGQECVEVAQRVLLSVDFVR